MVFTWAELQKLYHSKMEGSFSLKRTLAESLKKRAMNFEDFEQWVYDLHGMKIYVKKIWTEKFRIIWYQAPTSFLACYLP